MNPDEYEVAPQQRPRKFALRFSLLVLMVFVTIVCLALAWLVQPQRAAATALFRIAKTQPTICGSRSSGTSYDAQDYEIARKTQVALIKSYFVLYGSLRKPGIAALPLLKNQPNPEEWLASHLEVEFPNDSELLAIKLRGTEEQSSDLRAIVAAVAKSYQDEVLSKERAQQLGIRDMIARSLSNIDNQIQQKSQELEKLESESNAAGIASPTMRKLNLKRLDRVEIELMRLEGERLHSQTSEQTGNAKFVDERINQLRQQQAELEKSVTATSVEPAEVTSLKRDLTSLRRLAEDLTKQAQDLEIESQAPPRIEQVQPATISFER